MLISPMGFFAASGGAAAGAYELIATAYGTGVVGSVTFSSIPQDYKHLQIRASLKGNSTGRNVIASFNANTSSSSYYTHYVVGNGSTASSDRNNTAAGITLYDAMSNSTTASAASGVVLDILEYSSTNKFKTIRCIAGQSDANTRVVFQSGLYMATSAVTQITLAPSSTAFSTLSRFSLYGIRG